MDPVIKLLDVIQCYSLCLHLEIKKNLLEKIILYIFYNSIASKQNMENLSASKLYSLIKPVS